MKNMYVLSVLILQTVCMFAPISTLADDARAVRLKVTLLEEKRTQFDLEIELTNIGSESLTFFRDELPWDFRYSLLVVAARVNGSGALEEELPVVDPADGEKIQLKAGQTFKGTVSLNRRFPTLAEEIRKRDLIIFWNYELHLLDGTELKRVGGWLLIHKVVSDKSEKKN